MAEASEVRELDRRLLRAERSIAELGKLTAFDASSVLVGLGIGVKAGSNITLSKSGPFIVITGVAPGAGAATTDAFVTIGHPADLTAERALAVDSEHTLTDGGANGAATIGGVDAAAGQKGHLQLAGELGGTAAAPTVNTTHAGSSHQLVETLIYVVGDGTNVIPVGVYGDWPIQFGATVVEWDLLCSLPAAGGSLQLDLWKTTYANFDAGTTHPVVADTITGSDKPRIVAAKKGQSVALTGWTTALAAGDIVRVNVDSVTTIKLALLVLKVQRT